MRILSVIIITGMLTGCMAMIHGTANQLNQLSVGMPRSEVIQVLGQPKSTSAAEGIEYLQYRWVKTVIATDANWPEDYYVAIKDGKVSSFGRKGDFDSAKAPAQRIEIDQTVRGTSRQSTDTDLYTELQKLKELKDSGVLSEEEFNVQKKKLLDATN